MNTCSKNDDQRSICSLGKPTSVKTFHVKRHLRESKYQISVGSVQTLACQRQWSIMVHNLLNESLKIQK